MSEVFVNKVANSGLITLNLESYLPQTVISGFDLKDQLFMGLILKEKEYRESLRNFDWSVYNDKYVAVFCSVDAIVPVWAYMLAVTYLQAVAKDVYYGTPAEMYKHIVLQNIDAIATNEFKDQRIVVKGCGDITIEHYAYAEVTKVLTPHVKSIMYGEPCSTVPIFKRKS